jgi:hypothetical protein
LNDRLQDGDWLASAEPGQLSPAEYALDQSFPGLNEITARRSMTGLPFVSDVSEWTQGYMESPQ